MDQIRRKTAQLIRQARPQTLLRVATATLVVEFERDEVH